ncbi:diguanylate cyclase [Ornithinibacillus halotolerans]|uniref:Diguanylate cyclase n=1 Tax=Ornithinibacillus halotolerans TaxID=1274357 RepID=A0A916W4M9_9BACI|nr:diguanylate cyclase [Ornithinibacillus halotolerans]GGA65547.1 diguanylate cyclase [Ornithinibacillus halotolerans]
MEIINNRYRLKELIKQQKHVMVYSAYDMRNENKLILLNLLNTEYLPQSLLDFYITRFLDIKSLSSSRIIRNYSFNTVSFIDNNLQTAPQYYFTSDYVSNPVNLFEAVHEMTTAEVLQCFVDICSAVHYLHLKGFIHGALNQHTIQIVNNTNGYQVLLKDVATVQMEKLAHAERIEDTVFKSPKVLAGFEEDEESDIYALGILLLSMLIGNDSITSPRQQLLFLRNDTIDSNIIKLIPLLERLLDTDKEFPYSNIYDFIVDINEALNASYMIINKEEFQGLNLHTKLVGRDMQIEEVLKACEKMFSYQPSKRIFFIQGPTGLGKTRFLQEVKFLLDLSKASVYVSYSLKNSSSDSKNMWIDILRRFIMETDNQVVDKYKKELINYFPELMDSNYSSSINYTTEQNTKYRLLNRIAGFINESIQNRPTVILIDNIHLADDFTIDTFHYLCTEVLDKTNLTLVFTTNDSSNQHDVAMDFVENMKKRSDSETIYLEPLNVLQTGEMIRSILSMAFTPTLISKRIYQQSYGNPLFIAEIIKDLYSRQIIYVGENGRWHIDLPDENYNSLELPTSVEQALINQLKDLDQFSMEILMGVSIFSKPVSVEMLRQMNPECDEVEILLEDLVKKGVLNRLISDHAYLYDFRNKVLKTIVYEKIGHDEKVAKHQTAATRLEENLNYQTNDHLDELIFHFSHANDKEKARLYYLENAKRMKESRNIKLQLENLIRALEITNQRIEKVKLQLEIGELLSDSGDLSLAQEYLEQAEKLAVEENHPKYLLEVYLKLANAISNSYNDDKVRLYVEKAEKILESFVDEEASLEVKRLKASLLTEGNQILEAARLFEEVIAACGKKYHKIRGNAYRTLGFIYQQIGKTKEALDAYQKSLDIQQEIDNTRGVLLSLNNIGAFYHEVVQDSEKAMEYHIQVKHLSEELGIYTGEVFANLNIADYYATKYEFETAFEYLNVALTKAERYNMPLEKFILLSFLTEVSLERNSFSDAFNYFQKLELDVKNNPNKGFDIGEYYQTCARLFQALGNFEEADKYNQKVLQFHNEHENNNKFTATVQVLINQLRQSDKSIRLFLTEQMMKMTDKITNKSFIIESLCEAAIQLCWLDEFELGKQLLNKAEQFIQPDTPIRLKAIFNYAKGAVVFGESHEQTIHFLEESLDLAKNSISRELLIRIQADLGHCYFVLGRYFDAANYYLESSKGLKDLLSEIPDEFKLDYIQGKNLSPCISRLHSIMIWMISGEEEFSNNHSSNPISSLEEIQEFLTTNQAEVFIRNQTFMDYVSQQYMDKVSKGIVQLEDLFIHLDSGIDDNLKMIGNYLAGKFLATSCFVLAEDTGLELTVLSSMNERDQLPDNQSIFNRVRSTMKPVILSKWTEEAEIDFDFLPDELQGVACIPIIKQLEDYHFAGDNKQLLGYLYFETDKVVNNFNEQVLASSLQLVNFLVLLLEKRQLTISASIDKLTGALTRKYLEDALQHTLDYARKNRKEFSIIMYDLDKFKGVNDRYGHQVGDSILREVSQIIISKLDRSSIFGRYGGEEFIIVLPSAGTKEALNVAEMLRKAVQDQKLLGEKHEVTLSMGIVSFPENGQTVRELILKADQALYVAKENGRNNSQIWNKDFENKVKPFNKLTGIISGDEIKDARNVLALVEIIQLTNTSLSKHEKIYRFLGRMIEIIEAQYGYILLYNEDIGTKVFGRKSQEENWFQESLFNEKIVNTVLQSSQGLYTIDWERTDKINPVNGLPDWESVSCVPIINDGKVKGVIYLSVPARMKEFGADELNVLNVYSELVANII